MNPLTPSPFPSSPSPSPSLPSPLPLPPFHPGLCSWALNIVNFYEVFCDVEPKRKALAGANADLASAQEKLSRIKAKIKVQVLPGWHSIGKITTNSSIYRAEFNYPSVCNYPIKVSQSIVAYHTECKYSSVCNCPIKVCPKPSLS